MKKELTSEMGKTFIVRRPAAKTNGRFIKIDTEASPGKNHRPLQYHPAQPESFKLPEGSLNLLRFISKAFGNYLPKFLLASLLFVFSTQVGFSQSRFSKNELSINGFRNPSIGLEYRYKQFSLHGGYYVTNLTSGVTTQFVKTGLTYWFLPFGKQAIPSAFYVGGSYLRGLTRDYKDKNAFGTEAGVRFVVWKGLNFRLGVIALAAKGQELHVNPTPGISYSFSF